MLWPAERCPPSLPFLRGTLQVFAEGPAPHMCVVASRCGSASINACNVPRQCPHCASGSGAAGFWLRKIEGFDKIADANPPLSHRIQQAKAGFASQRLKEARRIKLCVSCHAGYIRIDECDLEAYSRFSEYVPGGDVECQSNYWNR